MNPDGMAAGALSDIRVIDMASLYAAPLAASFLADFGADVVKIEPPGGDSFRGTRVWPLVARNKRSVVLDLRSDEGCDALRRMVANADVIVENYIGDFLARRGLDWETLSAINPGLIMLSVSCYGATGPYAGRPGSGTIGEGFGGISHLTGEVDGPPMLPSLPLGDCMGAMSGTMGVLAALHWRHSSGRGQRIDASLYEPVLHAAAYEGRNWQPGASPKRMGSHLPGRIRNIYPTRDGQYVCISASTPRHEQVLMEKSGAKGPASEADPQVAAWILTQTLDEMLHMLAEHRLPGTAINDFDMLLADPHVQARGSTIRLHDEELGELLLAAPAPHLETTPGAIRSVNPPLGEATDTILAQWAGYTPEESARLAEAIRTIP